MSAGGKMIGLRHRYGVLRVLSTLVPSSESEEWRQ